MMVQSELLSIFNNVLGQKGRLRKGGTQITYHCPKCPDKNLLTRKLEISIAGSTTGFYHCWRCSFSGKSFGSLLKKLDAPKHYRDSVFKLNGDIRLIRKQNKQLESNLKLPDEYRSLAIFRNNPEYKNALVYLKRRGISREDILRYNIGYCEDGPYEYHIIIPSYDAVGELNFFIGRRYYDVPGTIPYKKPQVLMNFVGFESLINYNEPVILVEGAFNAITIKRNVIPLFGKCLSKKLCESLLYHNVKEVYVFLDSDALQDSIAICNRLIKIGITPYIVHAVGGKDGNEIGFENSWKCIKAAEEVDFSYLLKNKLKMNI